MRKDVVPSHLAALPFRMEDCVWAWHRSVRPSDQPSPVCDQSTWEEHICVGKPPTGCRSRLSLSFFSFLFNFVPNTALPRAKLLKD